MSPPWAAEFGRSVAATAQPASGRRNRWKWTIAGARPRATARGRPPPPARRRSPSAPRRRRSRPARRSGAAAAIAGAATESRTADRAAPGRSVRAARGPSTAGRRRARRDRFGAQAGFGRRSSATSAGSRSSSTASAAPRDAASKPSAPLPAKASRQRQPERSWPSQLKSVSRTRSGVGRRPGRSATGSLLRFHDPPMIRTSRGGAGCPGERGAAALRSRLTSAAPGCRRAPAAPWRRGP